MEDEAIQVDMNMMERAIGESRSLSFSHSDVSCSRGEMNRYMDRERERDMKRNRCTQAMKIELMKAFASSR